MPRWTNFLLAAAVLLAATGAAFAQATAAPNAPTAAPAQATNPLLAEWKTPFGVPPFSEIRPEHFMPAFKETIARERAEVDAVAAAAAPPTFDNTVVAMDLAGDSLNRVRSVFQNLIGAETNPELQKINQDVTPLLTALRDDILLNEALFARVKAVWETRDTVKLDPDQKTLLENTWKSFVRGGANLPAEKKERLRAINKELALAGVKFGDNLLKATNDYKLVIEKHEDLAGLPETAIQGAAETAAKAGMPGKWVFTLHWPSLWPFLQYADNRALREKILTANMTRCDRGDALDNKPLIAKMAALRAEKAQLLGYRTWADFVLDENMAKTPERVYALLAQLWTPAKAVAVKEATDLQAMMAKDGVTGAVEPWDWRYYTEKVRKARFDLDEQAVRPYFALENVRKGIFYAANKLYGITFVERPDIPVYNPEVKAFEVKDADGSHLGVFLTDYFPRPGKRSGAWSSSFRPQVRDVRPIVVNVGNLSRPAGDAPALLSADEVRTMFHEFGHALHGLLSKIRYRGVAATPRDFVELPSQFMENWAMQPEVLRVYAKHYKTGEVIPQTLVDKINASATFDQGFATVEYLAASLLDMDWHTLPGAVEPDVAAFERISLARIGMPSAILPRYRTVYFQHIFGPGGGYSAGYYAYIWAEVLVADAFEAFTEKGIFDQGTARSFRTNILEKGGSEDAMTLYVRFRGKEPSVEPLLKLRGLK